MYVWNRLGGGSFYPVWRYCKLRGVLLTWPLVRRCSPCGCLLQQFGRQSPTWSGIPRWHIAILCHECGALVCAKVGLKLGIPTRECLYHGWSFARFHWSHQNSVEFANMSSKSIFYALKWLSRRVTHQVTVDCVFVPVSVYTKAQNLGLRWRRHVFVGGACTPALDERPGLLGCCCLLILGSVAFGSYVPFMWLQTLVHAPT